MSMSGQKRVLVVGEYGILNGGERSFLTVCRALQQRGWKFVAAVPSGSKFAAALAEQGITNLGFSAHDADGNRLDQAVIRDQLRHTIRSAAPALLHANSLSMSRLGGPVTAELGLPAIGYLRDILKLSRRAIADINQLDCIVAVSNATAQWHIDQGLDADRVVTIYNGVDGNDFHPPTCDDDQLSKEALRAELGLTTDSRVILYVGQISLRKGIAALVDVFIRVADQHPAAHLLIVGQRNSTKPEVVQYERQVQQAVAQARLSQQVHWLGRRSDVPQLMRLADVLLHPARQEPLGRVLLEASASGLPIVTTAVGGSPEILPPSTACFSPDDIQGMANYAGELLSDASLCQQVSSAQQKIAGSRFSIDDCADRLEQTYRRSLRRYEDLRPNS